MISSLRYSFLSVIHIDIILYLKKISFEIRALLASIARHRKASSARFAFSKFREYLVNHAIDSSLIGEWIVPND